MNWLAKNWPQVLDLSLQHLALCLPAVILAALFAVPIGRLAFRRPLVGGPLLGAATLLYAIPALPLLVIIPALTGVPIRSELNMVIALTVYAIALLVRTSADAFGSVSESTRAAALAIGHSPATVFWRVDLPLAIPVLLSGMRVTTVSTIGLATLGALIGVPSLGTLLTDGFQRGILGEVAAGVGLTVTLALTLDGLLVLAGKWLTPWTRVERA